MSEEVQNVDEVNFDVVCVYPTSILGKAGREVEAEPK